MQQTSRAVASALFLLSLWSAADGCASSSAVGVGAAPLATALPPRDAGIQAVRKFFAAYSSGDVHVFSRMLHEQLSERVPRDEARLAARFAELRLQFGELTLHEVTLDERTVRAIARSDREGWVRFDFFFEATSEHKMTGQRLRPIAASADGTTVHAEDTAPEQIAANVHAYLRDRVDRGLFSGVVLVSQAGKPIINEAFGYAERSPAVPNTTETRFPVASLTKMFTAVAIGQLVERGLVSFDAPIERYLPDYPQPFAHTITVAMLLSHTSGLGDYVGHGYQEHPARYRRPDDFVRVWSREAPAFEPGTHFRYSNYGFVVLGRIVERVTGQAYADYVEQHIFSVAGMSRSSLGPEAQAPGPKARAYTRHDKSGVREIGMEVPANRFEIVPNPASNAWCTADDLWRFATALKRNELVSQDMAQALFTPRHEVEAGGALGEAYAYGFLRTGSSKVPRIGHGGEAPGMNAFFELLPSIDAIVIVIANRDPPAASWVGERIVQWLAPDP